MKFNTAIFDMDGVVIDSEWIYDISTESLLNSYGINNYNMDAIKRIIVGMDFRAGTEMLHKKLNVSANLEIFIASRRRILLENFNKHLKYVNGFKTFHRSLVKNYLETCIATAGADEIIEEIDSILNLTSFFDDKIYKISQVGHKSKPDPAIFLYSAQQMKVQPSECFVIEDSPKGIQAAKNANMFCVGITTTFDAKYLKGADIIVDKFADIPIGSL